MVADVLESNVPSRRLDSILLADKFIAESAPEVVVAFATEVHVRACRFTFKRSGFDIVLRLQMNGEGGFVMG